LHARTLNHGNVFDRAVRSMSELDGFIEGLDEDMTNNHLVGGTKVIPVIEQDFFGLLECGQDNHSHATWPIHSD